MTPAPSVRAGRLAAALTLLLTLGSAGCLPSRVVIDLAPGDTELVETEVLADPGAARSGQKVALIDISGLLSMSPSTGLFVGRSNAVDSLVARLSKAEGDPTVRAVVLRVNSPGGTVAASETMYNEVRLFRERSGKPVVVSMAEVAASGGYYVSLAADRLYAQPTTITGSIGVIIQTVNLSRGMQRIGIDARAVTSGPNKDLANPFVPEREGHFAILQDHVNEFYEAFRELVVERRTKLEQSDVDWATDGRVVTGKDAHEKGLVDALGGVREAFVEARTLAGLERARLVKYHTDATQPRTPYASAQSAGPIGEQGTQINLLQLNFPESLLPSAGFYYLWAPGVPDLP